VTHAELLRNHADLAVKEGGMYYSGEYLSRIAETAESLEAENAKLREQVDAAHMSRLLTENENEKLRELCGFMLRCMKRNHDCDCCLVNGEHCEISYIESDARELGVEVDE